MNKDEYRYSVGILGLLLLIAIGYGFYMRSEIVASEEVWDVERGALSAEVTKLTLNLRESESENEQLREALEDEQDRLRDLGEEVEEATELLSDLEKLAELDEELLKKYSKVAFLNENYVPNRLVDIRDRYLYDEDRDAEILRDVEDFLEDMLDEARRDGVTLWVRSAYRSFGTQAAVKTGYVVTYGAGTANQFSAEQGFSEHQLGTTVDFTTEGLNGALTIAFENTEAFKWLEDNAHTYGFIMSYPQGNAYYQYEPWHWRFVGRDLARDLNRSGENFYDLDQREIDGYLLEIFD